jgi:ubiquitin fusion degradation protein 1
VFVDCAPNVSSIAMWNGGLPFGAAYGDDDYGGGPGGVGPAPTGAFTRQFRAYPVSFLDRSDTQKLEAGDKIVLPPSALDTLARLNISFPMLFELESREGVRTHCGVLEFIAEEGHVHMPYWLMLNLVVAEGGFVSIRSANLPKGTYVKFQPQTSDFLDISNPKAVLEATLRGFTCLTKGDSIPISYNDKTYHIDVLEVAPGNAISIIEADVNVDFAAPKDYVEPEPIVPHVPEPVSGPGVADSANAGRALGGNPSNRLQKRLERLKKPIGGGDGDESDDDDDDDDSSDDDKAPPPVKFPGSGATLKAARAGSSSLTFGGGGAGLSASSSVIDPVDGEDRKKRKKKDVKPFTAFSGTGNSLR